MSIRTSSLPMKHLLSIEEAALRLDVSTSTVWRRVRDGGLATQRFRGRTWVTEDAINAYIQQRSRATP